MEVVAALPGVALAGVLLDWPQDGWQTWPELGGRFTYQPVWADGREAIVVRLDPRSGAAGEVVHLADDGRVVVLAPDVLSWWQALTSWAEDRLVALRVELGPEAADEEELSMLLEEALEQDFQEWLEERVSADTEQEIFAYLRVSLGLLSAPPVQRLPRWATTRGLADAGQSGVSAVETRTTAARLRRRRNRWPPQPDW